MTDYTTVTFPKALLAAVNQIIEEVGYWPSAASFVREACIEKLYKVRKYKE